MYTVKKHKRRSSKGAAVHDNTHWQQTSNLLLRIRSNCSRFVCCRFAPNSIQAGRKKDAQARVRGGKSPWQVRRSTLQMPSKSCCRACGCPGTPSTRRWYPPRRGPRRQVLAPPACAAHARRYPASLRGGRGYGDCGAQVLVRPGMASPTIGHSFPASRNREKKKPWLGHRPPPALKTSLPQDPARHLDRCSASSFGKLALAPHDGVVCAAPGVRPARRSCR